MKCVIGDGYMIGKNKLLYVECGITARTTINTGIQRVVRSITAEAKELAPQMGFEIVFVDFFNKKFKKLDDDKISINHRTIPFWLRLAVAIDRRLLALNFSLYFKIRVPIKYLLKKFIPKINNENSILNPYGSDGKPSTLMLLDSNWNNDIWPEIDQFRHAGGRVCAILYDLIPFTHPETVQEKTRLQHTRWWLEAPKHIDYLMCISESVKNDFLRWESELGYCSRIPAEHIGCFHLGSELNTSDPIIKLYNDSLKYYLMVGSIEPRKNHKIVLDAFEQLWQKGYSKGLVIVGGYGWKSDELYSRINEHPLLNIKLFIIRDATDRDLAGLYSNAEGLIMASIAEGFGLPIVEAQKLNCKVICSDIPVFKEIAIDDITCYFDPKESDSLIRILERQPFDEDIKYLHKQMSLTWRESTQQLIDRIDQIAFK